MMKMNPKILTGALLASVFASSASEQAQAQSAPVSRPYTHYQPDAQTVIGGRRVPIDIALLGPNGEETVGFYASLDPFHGRAFNEGWNIMYGRLIGANPRDTNPHKVEHVLLHMRAHGIKVEELKAAYKMAYQAWQKRPALRVNQP